MNENNSNTQKAKNIEQTGGQKFSQEDRQFTFKIIKRRSPWSKSEDDAIIELVNKHGTGNWTIIANEMGNSFGFKNRSGKQCRERWHNHLDPNVNKENWSEKEENILFAKHIEFGNKWSDIAKFLPGRTDNAIKNHFYSKFRKYIRKILKQINKENLMKINGIDSNQYNGDKIYKLLKKYKISYKNLNKETLLSLIVSVDKNIKNNNENSTQFLKNKTKRTKNTSSSQNASLHKINKVNLQGGNAKHNTTANTSKSKANSDNNHFNYHGGHKNHLYLNFLNNTKPQKKKKRNKRRKVSICLSTPENKKTQISKIMPRRQFFLSNAEKQKQSKRTRMQGLLRDLNPEINPSIEIIRPGLELHNNNAIVIYKSLLEKPKGSEGFPGSPMAGFQNSSLMLGPKIEGFPNTPVAPPSRARRRIPELTLTLTDQITNNYNPTPHYNNIPIDDNKFYSYFENQPQISPVSFNGLPLFPSSTRNLFSLDITQTYDSNGFFKTSTNNTFMLTTPKQPTIPNIPKTPTSREITLQNKILINEPKNDLLDKGTGENPGL